MDIAGIVLGYIAVIGGLAIGPFAIYFGGRQQLRKRELEHLERMKALEFGRVLPQDQPWLSPSIIGAMIAILGPVGTFVPVWLASQNAGFHDEAWLGAALVGIASVICGSILAMTNYKRAASSAEPAHTKPYIEEDAYDVVSSRG